jgi:sec-independent protein translocase protein TatC
MAAEDLLPTNINEPEMSVWDHIGELRTRLLKGMAALVIAVIINIVPFNDFQLATYWIAILARPVGGMEKLVAIEVTEEVGVYMRVGLLAGFILALPILVYQFIAFIIPGLYDNEKRWVLIAIPISTILFIGGVAFAYFVMLPTAIPFLLGFLPVKAMPRVSTYIDFVTNLMFWIGVAFETPLVVFVLAKFGVVTPAMLLKQWRFAVVIIAVLAAVITPTVDPVNMGLLMAPLFAIYLLSILFAMLAKPNKPAEEE